MSGDEGSVKISDESVRQVGSFMATMLDAITTMTRAFEGMAAELSAAVVGPNGCQGHGEHPHTQDSRPRRCLDCPVCLRELSDYATRVGGYHPFPDAGVTVPISVKDLMRLLEELGSPDDEKKEV